MTQRPGDKQPAYRNEALAPLREAAAARRRFEQGMQQVKRACEATPADFDRLERQILDLAQRDDPDPSAPPLH